MSDAVVLLMILPGLLLAIIMADAAGDRGAASYRASTFAVAAADHAADQIGDDPDNTSLWDQTADAVEDYGLISTWGNCLQTDPRFKIGLYRQPEAPAAPDTAAVLVVCPVTSSSNLADDTVTALAVRRLD